MLGAGALGRSRGMVWGGRREEGSGWGTHVYLWQIHFNIWQNQYNIVKFKKKKKKTCVSLLIFCFDDLSIGVSGVLKSPTIIVLLSISPFMSVHVCLMY